jgi:hypothetical protein
MGESSERVGKQSPKSGVRVPEVDGERSEGRQTREEIREHWDVLKIMDITL